MRKISLFLTNALTALIFTVGVFSVFPFAAEAQSNFVTCSGPECQFCHVVEMGSRITVWLIGIMFVIFGVIAAVAGFGLVTSAGNPSALSDAKQKLINALIGIVIVLAAWLIIDTVMQGLLSSTGDFPRVSDGSVNWYQVQCVNQPAVNEVKGQSYTSVGLAAVDCDVTYDPADPLNPIYDCSDQIDECEAIDGATATEVGGTVECDTPTGISGDAGGACDTTQMETINFLGGSVTVDSDIVGRLQAIDSAWSSSMYRVTSVGAYNCRAVTGGTRYSVHAYGLAIDINPAQNPYGDKVDPCPSDMPSSFVSLFTGRGFGWGGAWRSVCDAMHFSAASSEGGWISI